MGTPAYMSPEQARGQADLLDERGDVYAMGAMLYQLFVGRPPFVPAEGNISPHTLLARLLDGQPSPVSMEAPETPTELVAIIEKAMARDIAGRYANLEELATDLAAYLEGRVVAAYESGPWPEARKWVLRNRALAASLAAILVLSLGSLAGLSFVQTRAREVAAAEKQIAQEERDRADEEAVRANENLREAEEAKRQAVELAASVLTLSSFQRHEELLRRADELWPPTPSLVSAYQSWVARAEKLTERLDTLKNQAEELRKLSELKELLLGAMNPFGGRTGAISDAATISLARDDARDMQDWLLDQLVELIERIEGLTDAETGLLSPAGCSPEHGWSIPRRLRAALDLQRQWRASGSFAQRWARASQAIASVEVYAGLDLRRSSLLVPLGQDPESGLWEFWHPLTGSEPERNTEGRLVIKPESGMVFVLIPAGWFWMGSQADDPAHPNYDPDTPSRGVKSMDRIELDAFFVSKFELTQGQWLLLTGDNPSNWKRSMERIVVGPVLSHPVEMVDWVESSKTLSRFGMSLPSNAQWEYAARAGTESIWVTGNQKEGLDTAANLADSSSFDNFVSDEDLDDGFRIHGPVGSLDPNGFGLHDVIGNVREWCNEGYWRKDSEQKSVRGGGWESLPLQARTSARDTEFAASFFGDLGVRPVIPVR